MIICFKKGCLTLFSLIVISFLFVSHIWGGEPDITITATRIEEESFYVPQLVSPITSEEIIEKNFRTTPESLQEMPGILVQETAYGHGSPFIRGLTGKHILILVDGVRFNNSTFRFGPNQYFNNIDPGVVKRIEVVRGPSSVLYGSDAIGGVINVITKKRKDFSSSRDIDGSLTGHYGSSDESKTGRIEVSGNLQNLGFIGGKSYRDFGDLRGGEDTGLQKNTGYQENDGDIKLQYRFLHGGEMVAGYRRVHQMNVPRTDKFVYNNESFIYDPQIWNAFFAGYGVKNAGFLDHGLNFTLSLNQQIEGIRRQKFGSTTLRKYRDEVDTWGLSIQGNNAWGVKQLLTYGVEYYSDSVDSSRTDINLSTGAKAPKSGNFPDDAQYSLIGVFIQDEVGVTDRMSTIIGLRYSQAQVEATLPSPFDWFEDRYSDVTASISGVYNISDHLNGVFGVAQGFRSPNLDDTVVLEKITNEGIDVPSPDLKPEKSLNYEVGVKVKYPDSTGSLFYFYNDLQDLIERGPGTYNGQSFIDENGNGVEDPGEAVRQKFNIGSAYIQGVEAEGGYEITPVWSLKGNISWIYGMDIENEEPLSRIPPVMGLLGLKWKWPEGRYWAEYYARFAGRQDRLSSRDLTDPRINPKGTGGWTTHNFRGGVDFKNWGILSIVLENIFDTDYRIHGSGINAHGLGLAMNYSVVF